MDLSISDAHYEMSWAAKLSQRIAVGVSERLFSWWLNYAPI